MIIRSWLSQAKYQISGLEAELILAKVLDQERTFLVAHGEQRLSGEELTLADRMLKLRLKRVPLAYILGWKEFYGRRFQVGPEVLIPRPETEMAVELVEKWWTDGGGIVEVGTGSGCLVITLVAELGLKQKTEIEVVGLELSEEALKIANENARKILGEKMKAGGMQLKLLQSDLLQNYEGEAPEVIVANLPYVDRDWEWQSPELMYEPELALYAEDGGLRLIKLLLDNIQEVWYNGGIKVLLEADLSQHQRLITYAEDKGFRLLEIKGLWVVLRN
ncbi:MAG: HemK/PrmC family methyltransferase [Candidatus Saccharibacteria bacterium]|nr:HemK/PrmC family methyltransferase [Candidatus Saccharibacteria bacterium]